MVITADAVNHHGAAETPETLEGLQGMSGMLARRVAGSATPFRMAAASEETCAGSGMRLCPAERSSAGGVGMVHERGGDFGTVYPTLRDAQGMLGGCSGDARAPRVGRDSLPGGRSQAALPSGRNVVEDGSSHHVACNLGPRHRASCTTTKASPSSQRSEIGWVGAGWELELREWVEPPKVDELSAGCLLLSPRVVEPPKVDDLSASGETSPAPRPGVAPAAAPEAELLRPASPGLRKIS